MNERAKAALLLKQVIQQNNSLTPTLFDQFREDKEKSLIQELCYGSVRWFLKLKFIAEKLLHSSLRNKDYDIFCLILIGLYQIAYLNIPHYIVVSQTVDGAETLKKVWAKGLINKILRRFIKEKESLITLSEKTLESKYSHPLWLIETIKKDWPDHWQSILTKNNDRPPMTLRVNLTKISTDEYLQLLADHHIPAKKLHFLSAAIQLDTPFSIKKLPGFKEGYFYVQDAAGQSVADLLNIMNGQSILDACAAPGSKTTHILELNQNLKEMLILDKNKNRLEKIKENILRLGLLQSNTRLVTADANQIAQWSQGESFDRILLDAPCSAIGVIRRHPDIKLLRKPDDLLKYHHQQLNLLNSLWPFLKKDGLLLYSTCSILFQENENVIDAFFKTRNDIEHSSIEVYNGISLTYGVQILPGQDGRDGFYYARLKKVSRKS